jgi:hypothetical protein
VSYERTSIHEAGHIVVGLALDVSVDKVLWIDGTDSPELLRAHGFKSAACVDFNKPSMQALEPRRQFLIAMGGMASETLKLGDYDRGGAAEDLNSLKPNVLTDEQIQGLVGIGQLLLTPNLSILNRISEQLFQWLNAPTSTKSPARPSISGFWQKAPRSIFRRNWTNCYHHESALCSLPALTTLNRSTTSFSEKAK